MSIRAIAQEVYRCQAHVHKLQDKLEKAQHHEKEQLKEELRKALAELKVLKNMIDNRKAQSLESTKKYTFPLKR